MRPRETAESVLPLPATSDRPSLSLILLGHTLFSVLHAAVFSNVLWLLPLLVRLRFGDERESVRDWQTMIVTASVPTFLLFSIFWGELLQRMPVRRYLIIFWLFGILPHGCIGLAQNYWQLAVLHMLSAAGIAGWNPVQGQLLKRFYSDAIRGRMFGLLMVAGNAGSVISVYAIGRWIEGWPDGFRIYFPTVALLYLLGILMLLWLTDLKPRPTLQAEREAASWSRVLRPIWHMGQVLRADRTFLRYEIAFMTYGAAFMFCDALLPVLATTRLDMRYEDYSQATQVVYRSAMLLVFVPTGWLMDRLGPVRTSGIAFALLSAYPLLLLAADGVTDVAIASAIWGVGLAGVMMGWMLGPVALAPRPEKVPQYVAIHATLVGVRGVLFQGLGMLLYKLTGGFTTPLILAAAAFLFGAWQMWRLHGVITPAPINGAQERPTPGPAEAVEEVP